MLSIQALADEYYLSHDFKNLRDETKAQYKYFHRVMFDTNPHVKLSWHMICGVIVVCLLLIT
jgi:hypothetical protein